MFVTVLLHCRINKTVHEYKYQLIVAVTVIFLHLFKSKYVTTYFIIVVSSVHTYVCAHVHTCVYVHVYLLVCFITSTEF